MNAKVYLQYNYIFFYFINMNDIYYLFTAQKYTIGKNAIENRESENRKQESCQPLF